MGSCNTGNQHCWDCNMALIKISFHPVMTKFLLFCSFTNQRNDLINADLRCFFQEPFKTACILY